MSAAEGQTNAATIDPPRVGGWSLAQFSKTAWRRSKRVLRSGRQVIVERSPCWLNRIAGPGVKHLDMIFLDHALFRLVYLNKHRVGQQVWRSAQPTPHQIGSLARSGIRTIINLRGERLCGSYWLERDACVRHGITLINFPIHSRTPPSREQVRAACALFAQLDYPVLMHCKSGADRVGVMSVLYRFLHEGVPLEEAMRQLSLRYGHIRQADTGVLDRFFEAYLEHTRREPMAFLDWVDNVYDPVALKRSFRASGWARRLVDQVLRRE